MLRQNAGISGRKEVSSKLRRINSRERQRQNAMAAAQSAFAEFSVGYFVQLHHIGCPNFFFVSLPLLAVSAGSGYCCTTIARHYIYNAGRALVCGCAECQCSKVLDAQHSFPFFNLKRTTTDLGEDMMLSNGL
ncbi:hypothetical protein GN244_ATG15956 [Phytophthora infestans]|uniref:Uncharacterized protein n=1 Tax=Phytophthora infestans TaxID=4787 RepID=A0A833RSN7_PHYIN|nr:hypothetical protein GN244_ATG15956 [Phytophthora infestans]KAF4130416.1 hypothetical protein GN958_ATG20388 [Phytophthora infestans]